MGKNNKSGAAAVPHRLDAGIASRAAIGVVSLATDQTLEHEFRMLLGLPGVGVFHSRIAAANQVTPANLKAMEARIKDAVDLILPGVDLDVVAYGCTSASLVMGEEAVFAQIRKVRPAAQCTTPLGAAAAALRTLGAKRIGVLTPYRADINDALARHFAGRGFTVAMLESFHEEDDRNAARIRPADIRRAAAAMARAPGVDAVFVSCTNLRGAAAVPQLEQAAAKPVTTSNHAMAWHCLRLAGIRDSLPRLGALFALPCSA